MILDDRIMMKIKKMLWIKNMDESWMMNNDVTTCRIIYIWI